MLRDYKPFFFFGIIGLIFILLAVGFFTPVLIDFFKTGLVAKFPTIIVSVGCASIGVICWAIGLILEVIVKKHKQDFIINLNLLSNKKNDRE